MTKRGAFKRFTRAMIEYQAERIAELERRMAALEVRPIQQSDMIHDLERRIAELEARPVYPYYPVQPCDPPNPWVYPPIIWTCTISTANTE